MAAQRDVAGARPKIKREAMDSDFGGTLGPEGVDGAGERLARLRRTARGLAADAGFSPSTAGIYAGAGMPAPNSAGPVLGDSGARPCQANVKTPKYSGKADWEAFHAQFELLAHAAAWSEDTKALQLALCLTDDALACLLLLSPAERGDYRALVGALQRRFGQCGQPAVLRSELTSRRRQPGEPLRALANDIEMLAKKAYAHMPIGVQNELARDQFIRAMIPGELRIQTQLSHPRNLHEALEMALEREAVVASAGCDHSEYDPVVRAAVPEAPGQGVPAWAAELTELVRGVSLQSSRRGARPRRDPPVCWTCGQLGHISVRCPDRAGVQGNASGPA